MLSDSVAAKVIAALFSCVSVGISLNQACPHLPLFSPFDLLSCPTDYHALEILHRACLSSNPVLDREHNDSMAWNVAIHSSDYLYGASLLDSFVLLSCLSPSAHLL